MDVVRRERPKYDQYRLANAAWVRAASLDRAGFYATVRSTTDSDQRTSARRARVAAEESTCSGIAKRGTGYAHTHTGHAFVFRASIVMAGNARLKRL
jgi:hypothetical protein